MYVYVCFGCKHGLDFTCILKFHGDIPVKQLHLLMSVHIVTFLTSKINVMS